MLIRVTRQINSVVRSAERTASKVENTVSNISAVTSPIVMGKVASAFMDSFKKSK